jgi:hypothetical protein
LSYGKVSLTIIVCVQKGVDDMNKCIKVAFSSLLILGFLCSNISNNMAYASEVTETIEVTEVSEGIETTEVTEVSEGTETSEPSEVSEVDKLFSEAFNGVKKVIVIGTENEVKPFYFQCEGSLEPGISESEAVAQGVDKGLQLAIYEARVLVDNLPESIVEYKKTFSAILDNYQYAIFERIESIVGDNQEDPVQRDVILGRSIIKNLDSQYKATYSEALDKIQSKLFTNAMELVAAAEATKMEADLVVAEDAIAELKTIPEEFSSEDINTFINDLDNKLSGLKKIIGIYKITSMKKVTNMPAMEVTPDNVTVDLGVAVPEGYTLYCTFQWINTVYDNKPTVKSLEDSYLKTKVVGDGSTEAISLPLFYNEETGTSLPVQDNYLFYFVNNATSKVEYVSKNPIRLTLGVQGNITEKIQDGSSLSETTMKVNSSAAYSGYITHEIIGKSRNTQVSHSVLINKGDSPLIITMKIKNNLDEFSSTYLPNTQSIVEGDELTIKSWESLEITQKIH